MSIGNFKITGIGYTWVVNKGKIADYLERNWLKYQQEHGRNKQAEMAAILGISQPYFNMLLEGKKTTVKYVTALHICTVFEDYSLMDVLGYPYEPPGDDLDAFPPRLREALLSARDTITSRGLVGDSPEAAQVVIDAMNAAGYKLILTDNSESAK